MEEKRLQDDPEPFLFAFFSAFFQGFSVLSLHSISSTSSSGLLVECSLAGSA